MDQRQTCTFQRVLTRQLEEYNSSDSDTPTKGMILVLPVTELMRSRY